MRKLLLILFFFPLIGFGQNKDELQLEERPKDYEYLSAPDSNGVRRNLKMPSVDKLNQNQNLPYPIIFIHGLWGDCSTWDKTTEWMTAQYNLNYAGRFDFCLNRDDDNSTANLNWWPSSNADLSLFQGTWVSGDYYFINFDVGIDGSFDPVLLDPVNVRSNQAAIAKQGKAVSRAIQNVLSLTGRDKVILMGHSMGGLAAREYLQNPSIWQADGLSHVAKLITLGTPHGGSDANTDVAALLGVSCATEAYRDLRSTYSGTNAPGVYLFGGIESSNIMSLSWCSPFYNLDVNCSGAVGANITGLNTKPIYYTSIDYACVIGQCSGCVLGYELPGDGIVNESKANINNYFPGLTNNIFYYNGSASTEIHTDLTEKNYQNMQALDEPNTLSCAYNIDFQSLYTGMITMQPTGGNFYDYDSYKFYLPESGHVFFSITDINHPDLRVRILDGNSTQSSYIPIGNTRSNNGSTALYFIENLSAGSYYLQIFAEPTSTTYYDSYKFYLNSSVLTNLEEYTANRTLSKVVDVLGRETKQTNQSLFYIYDDGTVEKRIIIE